jgi:hypothetical protein
MTDGGWIMATCPYCDDTYAAYSIVGVLPANEHLTDWLDPVPVAQLVCRSCGRYTFMHPDHPDVQRLPKQQHYELQENVRTLNVEVGALGDPELREQFEHGR